MHASMALFFCSRGVIVSPVTGLLSDHLLSAIQRSISAFSYVMLSSAIIGSTISSPVNGHFHVSVAGMSSEAMRRSMRLSIACI